MSSGFIRHTRLCTHAHAQTPTHLINQSDQQPPPPNIKGLRQVEFSHRKTSLKNKHLTEFLEISKRNLKVNGDLMKTSKSQLAKVTLNSRNRGKIKDVATESSGPKQP